MNAQKTTYPKKEDNQQKFVIFDAEGQVLGRLAAKIATVLRGKHKPNFHPAVDMGDSVVVINAEKVVLTGRKLEQKKYYRHSGYPGAISEIKYSDLIRKKPEFVVQKAVKGMIPHNSLGRQQLKKLKVYAGSEHPHVAQKPVQVEL